MFFCIIKGAVETAPLKYRFIELSEKAKNTLVALISLSEHRLTCLLENVPVRELNHLRSHVGITDTGLSCCGILNDIVKVADGVLKSVLNCTEIRSLSVNVLDSILDGADSCLSIAVSIYLDVGSSNSETGC